ncbi:MAG: TetR/AcrR family transcriptional regulator [Lachnospiraceae bacterium]|nr:TetR/AcrR family transcriptional regulator [Lachnospiraceae bacterium]
MAFSKGKRIEDETSRRIVELAVNIGCKEGADVLTVTRLCRELNCDRRVIYNRFRDIDEINLIVARRCNEELMASAKAAVDPQNSFYERFYAFIKAAFTYIYEKNRYFQHYTALYQITDHGVKNEILLEIMQMIEDGKTAGDVRAETDSYKAAESIWIITTGIGGMLAANGNYRFQDGLNTMLYGVEAIVSYMSAEMEDENGNRKTWKHRNHCQ